MTEVLLLILGIFISRAFFMMLRCPNCETLKSIFLQKRINGTDEDGREQINCKVCNHSWKRLPLSGSSGGDGGGFS